MIIKGYNGIMDLDLTNIPKHFHKELIELHYKDITDYKKEQAKLKPHLRYENTILKAFNRMIINNDFLKKKYNL